MTTYTPCRRARGPVATTVAWTLAAVVGWATFHLVGGASRAGVARDLVWTGCLLVAVVGAALVAVTLGRRLLVDDATRWGAAAAVGWGVANAAGWFLAVEVGGPASGLVTGAVVGGAAVGVSLSRGVALGLCGVLAMILVRLPGLGLPPFVGLAVNVVAGLAVVAVLRPVLAPTLPMRPVVVGTVSFGLFWVGAWTVTDALLSPLSATASVGAEIVVAVTLGSAVLGRELRGRTAEPVRCVALRWAGVTVLGVVGSVGVAVVVATVVPGATPIAFLDVGTTLGLPVAAWCALRPTLARLTGSCPPDGRNDRPAGSDPSV